jgi:predicted metal-dependent hydrolase
MADWPLPQWLRRGAADPVVELPGGSLPLVIRRLPQARRLTLRLAPDGSEARVTMPSWARTADALTFARTRADWLAEQLARLPVGQPFGPGALLPWGGGELLVDWGPGHPRRLQIADGRLVVGGPVESLGPRVRRWLQAEGRARFAVDLADYCARAGQSVPMLALTSAQRRWGSCSRGIRGATGTIRLNWRLVMAPDAVRRSVVAHEVAHLVHFNHSPAFHALLGELFEGDLDGANRWLRRHGRALYAPLG